ncbi:MAG: hypothetical protein ACXVUE_16920 [Solirubrobacteraceae bacterium]
MNTGSPIESHTSPVPGVIPGPAPRRTPLARLLAALRGDKYMVDAYAPAVPPEEG